jgi:Rhs element Vgr protein
MPEERAISTSRPATVVTPVIRIDGNEIARTFQVDSITVRKEINRIPWAKVILLDGEASAQKFSASDGNLFIPGKEIDIQCGYQNDTYTLFKGIVISHSIKVRSGGNAMLVLECRDQAVKMTIGRKSRYFLDKTDSDIWSAVAGNYSGIKLSADATRVKHPAMVQYDCSDWDFIVSRAEACGRLCITDDGSLGIKAPDFNQTPVLSLLYGATILELDAEMDARHQLKDVTAQGWNYSDQKMLKSNGTDPAVRLNGNLSPADLAKVTGSEKFLLNQGGNLEEKELQAWGDALLLKRQLAKVRGRVKCKGIHTVKPGVLIELGGVGDRFNGKAFVSGIQHFIAAGDWQLDIQFGADPDWFSDQVTIPAKPAAGLVSAVHGLQVGKVVQIEDDPAGEHRIKVHLPVIGNSSDGLWCRVSTLDAGNERGSFFRPEPDDEVIVGFINDDPRQAVVLGMVNSSALPAPLQAEGGNPKKGFVTRSKINMIFDDDKKSFTLETPAGKKIVVDEDAGEISILDENENKVVLDSNGITLTSNKNIELKASGDIKLSGMNVSVAAQSSLKMEGTSGAEVKASGNLTLKGAIVQIN